MNKNTLVKDIQTALTEKGLTMTMSYSEGAYQCILRPKEHVKGLPTFKRAKTYIEAMSLAFQSAGVTP